MKWEVTVDVSGRFEQVERQERMELSRAGELLRTRQRDRYTRAMRMGEEALLVCHRVRCPYCGWETPAYPRFLTGEGEERLPRRQVEEWASAQLSLYEVTPAVLELNRTERVGYAFACPRCGTRPRQEGEGRLTVRTEEGRLELLLRTEEGEEGLVFDPGQRQVRLTAGEKVRDVSFDPAALRRSGICRVLEGSHLAWRRTVQGFGRVYGRPLPYTRQELQPEDLTALTLFFGYDRAFYGAIPWDSATGSLHGSFREMAAVMGRAEELPEVYRRSALPAMKTVRRLFFREPGLFFYLREAEVLWEAVQDPNVFCRLVGGALGYPLLAFLNRFGGGADFLRDYGQLRGKARLARLLEQDWVETRAYAMLYGAMSEGARREEQRRWQREAPRMRPGGDFALPLRQCERAARSRTVDGFLFRPLKTMGEHVRVGLAMHNCLTDWPTDGNPVTVVIRDGRYRAAIETEGDKVVQVLEPGNRTLDRESPLGAAVERWMALQGLQPPPEPEEEEEEEFFF